MSLRGTGVPRSLGCHGEIQSTLKRGRTPLTFKTVRLDRRCHYRVRFRVLRSRIKNARRLTIEVRFLGNNYLAATEPKAFTVKVHPA
jgi:hypothetical protein